MSGPPSAERQEAVERRTAVPQHRTIIPRPTAGGGSGAAGRLPVPGEITLSTAGAVSR